MYCKKCGKELEDNAVFCQFCGQKQNEEIEEGTKEEKGDISDKKLILVGAIVAVVILAVIAIVKFAGKGKEENNAEIVLVEESVGEESVEGVISEHVTELGDGKAEEGAEDVTEETETASDLQKDETPIVKYMKVGDSECWYDEDGDLVKASNVGWASKRETRSFQYVTDADGNKVCGDQMYFEIQPISVSNKTVSILTTLRAGFLPYYNEKGHLIQSIYGEYDNGDLFSCEYVYDSKNRVIEAKCEESGGVEDDKSVLFEYLEGGNRVIASCYSTYYSQHTGHNILEPYRVGVLRFNSAKMSSIIVEGGLELDESWERGYDINGNIVREGYKWGGHIEEYKYQYDENGDIIRIEESVTDGNEASEEIGIEYQYDESGNLIKIEEEGKESITEYQYDESGNNIIREEKEQKDSKSITEYQYDEDGNQMRYERASELWAYDGKGNMTQHTSSSENGIYEYDEEGKLISYAQIGSITGGDVSSFDSQYLYDDQGRISEIVVNGEIAIAVSYNKIGMLEKIDSIIEVEDNDVLWQLIYDLLPLDEQIQGMDYKDYINQDITIEYR